MHDFFSSDSTQTGISVVESVAGDSAIGDAAGKLGSGIDKVNTVTELGDDYIKLKEANDAPTKPEQAAGILKVCLKYIKKIMPVQLTPTELAEQALDQGMEHAIDQRDTGTINYGAQRQMREIEW